MTNPTKLLFVCLGNIVRSPLAEALFAHRVKEAGLGDKYQVDSAGTAGYHIGDSPDARMRAVAAAKGLVYDGSGRKFRSADFDRFDLIIAMDHSNKANILSLAGSPQQIEMVRLLREFESGDATMNSTIDEVPDPYYGGMDGFEQVYEIVDKAIMGLLATLEAGELRD